MNSNAIAIDSESQGNGSYYSPYYSRGIGGSISSGPQKWMYGFAKKFLLHSCQSEEAAQIRGLCSNFDKYFSSEKCLISEHLAGASGGKFFLIHAGAVPAIKVQDMCGGDIVASEIPCAIYKSGRNSSYVGEAIFRQSIDSVFAIKLLQQSNLWDLTVAPAVYSLGTEVESIGWATLTKDRFPEITIAAISCDSMKKASNIKENLIDIFLQGRNAIHMSRAVVSGDFRQLSEIESIKGFFLSTHSLGPKMVLCYGTDSRIECRKGFLLYSDGDALFLPNCLRTIDRFKRFTSCESSNYCANDQNNVSILSLEGHSAAFVDDLNDLKAARYDATIPTCFDSHTASLKCLNRANRATDIYNIDGNNYKLSLDQNGRVILSSEFSSISFEESRSEIKRVSGNNLFASLLPKTFNSTATICQRPSTIEWKIEIKNNPNVKTACPILVSTSNLINDYSTYITKINCGDIDLSAISGSDKNYEKAKRTQISGAKTEPYGVSPLVKVALTPSTIFEKTKSEFITSFMPATDLVQDDYGKKTTSVRFATSNDDNEKTMEVLSNEKDSSTVKDEENIQLTRKDLARKRSSTKAMNISSNGAVNKTSFKKSSEYLNNKTDYTTSAIQNDYSESTINGTAGALQSSNESSSAFSGNTVIAAAVCGGIILLIAISFVIYKLCKKIRQSRRRGMPNIFEGDNNLLQMTEIDMVQSQQIDGAGVSDDDEKVLYSQGTKDIGKKRAAPGDRLFSISAEGDNEEILRESLSMNNMANQSCNNHLDHEERQRFAGAFGEIYDKFSPFSRKNSSKGYFKAINENYGAIPSASSNVDEDVKIFGHRDFGEKSLDNNLNVEKELTLLDDGSRDSLCGNRNDSGQNNFATSSVLKTKPTVGRNNYDAKKSKSIIAPPKLNLRQNLTKTNASDLKNINLMATQRTIIY